MFGGRFGHAIFGDTLGSKFNWSTCRVICMMHVHTYACSAATMEAAVHEVCFNCPPFVSDHYGVLATLMKPDRREEVKAVAKPQ